MTDAQNEWARCRPWIEAALATNDFFNIEYVEREIERGEMTFWPGDHGAAVTEFINYPNGRALNVFAIGGDANASLQELQGRFEPCLITWATAAKCRWIIGLGRDGWAHDAKARGYRKLWTVFAKELEI